MKFAYSMLKDFIATKKTAEEIGELLTMAGFEIEGIEQVEGEEVFDVKVGSNRGDGLSVLGLAREVLAKDSDAKPTELYDRARERFALKEKSAISAPDIQIQTDDCTRFSAQSFEGDFSRSAPEQMRKRLRVAGIRSISLLVDLTNYVMLELGQPMHAYDLDKLHGHKLIARKAKKGEKLVTLDGATHDLNANQMIIADEDRAVGAAGIMGGLDTEVSLSTKRILLESANFVNTSVRRTRKEMSLSTEASYRFERSVDSEGTVAAINRFAELLADTNIKRSQVADVYPRKPEHKEITLRISRATELLGMTVTSAEAKNYLERLGFKVSQTKDGVFQVAVPSWRPDIVQEYDLVEEIGRVHGYERIPEAPLQGTTTQGGVFELYDFVEQLRGLAMRLGFIQNISYSLRDKHPLDDRGSERVGPRNPGSPEMAWLRNSLWPSLADNARRNGGRNLRLFEMGQVFGTEGKLSEDRHIAFLATGNAEQEHWETDRTTEASFFSLKGVMEEILEHAGIEPRFEASNDPRLHPARQARSIGKILFGQIHPDIAEQLDLPPATFLAQADVEELYRNRNAAKGLKPISRNPAVRRDIAILIDQSVPYSKIAARIEASTGDILEKHWLFDVYAGKGIPEGKHSLAIALQLRKFGENLTDEEANQVRDRAVLALAELGATQR